MSTPTGDPGPPPPDDAYQYPAAPYPDVPHPAAPHPMAPHPMPRYSMPQYPMPQYPAAPYPMAQYPPPYPGGPNAVGARPTAPYGVSAPGTNGKAMASLITALAGIPLVFLFGIPSLVAVVLGVIALMETGRTGQQGRGLAVAGIVVGAATFLLVVLGFVLLVVAAGSAGDYYSY